jgi:AcrR family transcriptional regulator
VGKISLNTHSDTRQQLLDAGLKTFAERGYAAASVQEIVDAAQVSKPALYYYFADKAGLFQALVHQAHDERHRLLLENAARGQNVAEKLQNILTAVLDFSLQNKELMRLTFATAFATNGEAPGQNKCREKARRNFDVVRTLLEEGRKSGELDNRFTADELAMAFYGHLNAHVMVRLLLPDWQLEPDAPRRIVKLFLEGAAPKGK